MHILKNKKFIIISAVLTTFIIAAAIIGVNLTTAYLTPIEIQLETILCNRSNHEETVEVTLDLQKNRHLFKPTQLTGRIIFDGEEYESAITVDESLDVFKDNSFWDNLMCKLVDGYTHDSFVLTKYRTEPDKLFDDWFIIEIWDDDIVIEKFGEDISLYSSRYYQYVKSIESE